MNRFVRNSLGSLALLSALVAAGPAAAAVNVRVEGRPESAPIQVFVRVTDGNNVPINNLNFQVFQVEIDGIAEVLTGSQFSQPQEADPDQHVSVMFVMDYTSSVTSQAQFLAEMQDAVIEFIRAMEPGDMAAIIKFNNDSGEQVIQPFTDIDDNEVNGNDKLLIDAVASDYPGDGSNILDAVNLGVQEFAAAGANLPPGPKAVILVSDGRDSHSDIGQNGVIEAANDVSIPIFTIGIGNPQTRGLEILTELSGDTGGEYFDATDGGDIGAAYESVRLLLTGEYLIEIPNGITDCATHQLTVTVQGETDTTSFTRRTCNTTPSAFTFASQSNVERGTVVTSSTSTISGIEADAHVSVINGSYSIGCTGDFTTDPGTIADGETVCLQQTTATQASTSKTTTLTVGGLAVTFTTTTRAQSGGGGGGGGGGGANGLLELLLGLSLVFMRRRLTA
jgi:VWFA-related protein